MLSTSLLTVHDNVIKWKHFPRYWPFVRGIHRSPVNSPHKGQWRGALMFSLIRARINGWVNNGEAGNLGRHRTHYDVIVMCCAVVMTVMTIARSYSAMQCKLSCIKVMNYQNKSDLIHWDWVKHLCVSKVTIIGSDNGLSPGRRQAIIWTNVGILLIGPLIWNKLQWNILKCIWNCRQKIGGHFPGLNVLIHWGLVTYKNIYICLSELGHSGFK